MWGDVLSLNVEMCYFFNVEMYCVLVGFDSFEE